VGTASTGHRSDVNGGGRSGGLALAVGALGVVFGDIGTSPLYAMKSVLGEAGTIDRQSVYGLTSTVVWALLLVVTALYVGLLLRVDNEGEGGLLALLALLRRTTQGRRAAVIAVFVGMIGAATFLGDSVITPAITVLSASEGLTQASTSLHVVVLPAALLIIAGVFVLQRVGTGRIGRFYGPIMVVWFGVLAAGGLGSVLRDPGVFAVLSPHWAVLFAIHDPVRFFVALGSVILAVTGAEALYADLGHFGRPAITRSWLLLVLPALLVSYLGEAAEVVRDPSAAGNPFYAVVPSWATIPVLVIATAATIIASEAVIAGAFTVLHQAGGLGLLPVLRTRHTSSQRAGQIYLPAANWALAGVVLAVVLGFRSSERLAAAYGLAVSVTILTTVSLYVALSRARRSRWHQVAGALFWLVMLAFFAAAVPKLISGGWLPVLIGVAVFVTMWSWRSGQERISVARRDEERRVDDLVAELAEHDVERMRGDGVFLTYDPKIAPMALRTMLELGPVLPSRVVLLSWHVEDTPTAHAHETRERVDDLGCGVLVVDVTLGYRERLDVIAVLDRVRRDDDRLDGLHPDKARYFVSDPLPQLERRSPMPRWRQRIYLLLDRLATDRVEQLELPRDRTITVGRELRL